MKKSKQVRLSPSRINSIKDCSWSYYANYHLRLPQTANDGNRRGNICHGLLEHLAAKKHHHYVQKIIDAGNPFFIPVIARYLTKYAIKEELPLDQLVVNKDKNGLMTHREEIANMLIVALKERFLGEEGDEILPEMEKIIEVHDGKKDYCIKGIVDKVFVRRNDKGEIEEVEIVDYKTSSKKFDDIEENIQGLVYQFFARTMYPTAKRIKFGFLFLRFPRNPWQEVPEVPAATIEGLEHYLTYLSKYMSEFTEAHAKSNFAKNDMGAKFLCGLHGNKSYRDKKTGEKIKHDEPQFICGHRDPYDYYAVVDEDGNNIRSSRTPEGLKLKQGEVMVKRRYMGCPAWHAQTNNLKRDWSALT